MNQEHIKIFINTNNILFEILEEASNKIFVYEDERISNFITIRNLTLNLIFIFNNSIIDIHES